MQPAPRDSAQIVPFSQFEKLRLGRDIVRREAEVLNSVARQLDATFCAAVDCLLQLQGSVIVSGMGKAGLVGKKIAATLSSTGTRAHFLHPAEAVHGDVGCVHESDVVLALSNSGETEELCQLIPIVRRLGTRTIAITGSANSTLASLSDIVISLGRIREACPWGLAPTTSTTAMLAVGDALALVVSQINNFTPVDFAKFHPGGSLGKRLKPVAEIMRPRDQLRLASVDQPVREVFASTSRPGRRSGAILLTDESGALAGIFTDSDLARLLESRQDADLDRPIADVMTRNPTTVPANAVFGDIVDVLADRKISEVPVVDENNCPVGLIDITDVIGWLPTSGCD